MTDEHFFRGAISLGDVHVVVLGGELDLDTAEGLSDWLVELAGSSVVVDLSRADLYGQLGYSCFGSRQKSC